MGLVIHRPIFTNNKRRFENLDLFSFFLLRDFAYKNEIWKRDMSLRSFDFDPSRQFQKINRNATRKNNLKENE